MPTIAVVMATFNGEAWLNDQLASIAQQTRLPDRLVISDDGSTDNTVELAKDFARGAPFEVVLLEGPHAGIAENFWYAARHAHTSVIAWCDQDDVWFPQKLELCESLMETNNVPYVTHSALVTDAALVPRDQLFPRYRKTRVVQALAGDPWWCAPGFTTLFRAELLQLARWDDRPVLQMGSRLGHDNVIALLAFATGPRLEISDVMANYRQHESNKAGAPKKIGVLEKSRFALALPSTAHSDRAEIASVYAEFIAMCDPLNTEAIDYFSVLQARSLRRAKIQQSPGRLSGACNLLVALAQGDFGRKSRGRFGVRALARDLMALGLGAHRYRRSSQKRVSPGSPSD